MKQYIYYTKVYNVRWAGIFRQYIYICVNANICICVYMNIFFCFYI
jgi:hypothetical protein